MEQTKKSSGLLDNVKVIDKLKNERQVLDMAEGIKTAKLKIEVLLKNARERESLLKKQEDQNSTSNFFDTKNIETKVETVVAESMTNDKNVDNVEKKQKEDVNLDVAPIVETKSEAKEQIQKEKKLEEIKSEKPNVNNQSVEKRDGQNEKPFDRNGRNNQNRNFDNRDNKNYGDRNQNRVNNNFNNQNYQNRNYNLNSNNQNNYQNRTGYQNNNYQNRGSFQGNGNYQNNGNNQTRNFNGVGGQTQKRVFDNRNGDNNFYNRNGFGNNQGGQRYQNGTNGQRPFGQRPPMNRPQGPKVPFVGELLVDTTKNKHTSVTFKKKTVNKPQSKVETKGIKLVLRNGLASYEDDDSMSNRRQKQKKGKTFENPNYIKVENAVITTSEVSVKTLSEKIGQTVASILGKLMMLGTIANINSNIDFFTAELVACEFGVILTQKIEKSADEQLQEQIKLDDEEGNTFRRFPVVTVMGHVDHGKTSLLDKIRHSNVSSSEAGGITQHIGAYTIDYNGNKITFIDTPGHEAFTAMRERGASVTDCAILVVAADDGVMPQTKEAINQIKTAGVPMIVAINKIDKAEANIERIKQQLSEVDVLTEEWGGDTIMVPISARDGTNIDTLLETVLAVTELSDLRANPNRNAVGTVIEAKLDKGKGPVATILVQNGTLHVGDTIISGLAVGRVRAMANSIGQRVKEAGPSIAVSILGLDQVPHAGDKLIVVDEKVAKQVVSDRKNKVQLEKQHKISKITTEELLKSMDDKKPYNVIIKTDVQGSYEALENMLSSIENEEIRVKCVHGGVGAVTETDVDLAIASGAKIIAFNVKTEVNAQNLADRDKVEIGNYKVIYNVIDDVQKTIKSMLTPIFEEKIIGHCEVRVLFKISKIGTVAGCYVLDGKIQKNAHIRVMRAGTLIIDTPMVTLQRDKQDVKEVVYGQECGIKLEGFNDIKDLDIFEAYIMERVER